MATRLGKLRRNGGEGPTQGQLAAAMECSKGHIANLALGAAAASRALLRRFARSLGCSPQTVLRAYLAQRREWLREHVPG